MMEMTPGARQDLSPLVVATGAVTAVGVDAAMTAASVRAGLSGFRESVLISRAGEPMVVAECDFLETGEMGASRLSELSLDAFSEALAPIREIPGMTGLALCLGMAEPRTGLEAGDAQAVLNHLERHLNIGFPPERSLVMAEGHGAGLKAVAQAVQWIQAGDAQLVMAGGVDAYLHADTLEWLDDTGRLHTDDNPDGFIPGEGAGFCLLASETAARRYGLTPLARIRAAATAVEPHPFYSEGICIGQGLTHALQEVLAVLRDGEKVHWTLCDMNGESFRGNEWMYSYLRTALKHADPLALWHPADCFGDIGAASGPVLMALAIQAWVRGYARGDRCLIWTASDHGLRSALVMERAADLERK